MVPENNNRIIHQKRFLTEGLPEGLTAADSHLQIFDNYIENTRIRLRKIRVPETKQWTRVLEQIKELDAENPSSFELSQMFLTEAEYKTFEVFKGREIRKNRYFCELGDFTYEIDIFLGALWGLNIARVVFDDNRQKTQFEIPEFAVLDISDDKFFSGNSLVDVNFGTVQDRISKI